MTFSKENLAKASVGYYSSAPEILCYETSEDNVATVAASGYFNDAVDKFSKYDLLYVVASDDERIFKISSESGVTPVTVDTVINGNDLEDGSVTTDKLDDTAVTEGKLANSAVSQDKLATAVQNTHVTKAVVTHSYGGGGTTSVATVTGAVAATDFVFATILTSANDASLAGAQITADNEVTITYSADPGASTEVNIAILRPVS